MEWHTNNYPTSRVLPRSPYIRAPFHCYRSINELWSGMYNRLRFSTYNSQRRTVRGLFSNSPLPSRTTQKSNHGLRMHTALCHGGECFSSVSRLPRPLTHIRFVSKRLRKLLKQTPPRRQPSRIRLPLHPFHLYTFHLRNTIIPSPSFPQSHTHHRHHIARSPIKPPRPP